MSFISLHATMSSFSLHIHHSITLGVFFASQSLVHITAKRYFIGEKKTENKGINVEATLRLEICKCC